MYIVLRIFRASTRVRGPQYSYYAKSRRPILNNLLPYMTVTKVNKEKRHKPDLMMGLVPLMIQKYRLEFAYFTIIFLPPMILTPFCGTTSR